MRQFLAFYGELSRERRLYAGTAARAMPSCRAATARPAGRCRPLTLADLIEPARPPACRSSSRNSSTSRRRCSSRSAAWTGSRTRSTSRCGPTVRLNSPVTAIRRRGDGRAHPPRPGRRRRSTPIIASAPCRSTCCSASRATSRRPSRRRSATSPICRASRSASNAPRFWEEEGIYGGLGWTDQAERESALSVGRLAFGQGRAGRRLLRRAGPGRTISAEFTAMSHEERFRVCREVGRAHASRASRGCSTSRSPSPGALTPWSEGVGPVAPDFGARPRGARRAMPSCSGPKARSSSPASISATSSSGRKARRSRPTRRCGCWPSRRRRARPPPVEAQRASGRNGLGERPAADIWSHPTFEGDMPMLKRALLAAALALAARRRPRPRPPTSPPPSRRRGGPPTRSRSTPAASRPRCCASWGSSAATASSISSPAPAIMPRSWPARSGRTGSVARLEPARLRGQRADPRRRSTAIRQRTPNIGFYRRRRRRAVALPPQTLRFRDDPPRSITTLIGRAPASGCRAWIRTRSCAPSSSR